MGGDLSGYARYAVYAAPPTETALGGFGAAWLGWDAGAGAAVPRVAVEGLPEPIEALTVDASRYGFHGTMKAPFRLAEGCDAEGFSAAVEALAGRSAPVETAPLEFSNLHGFVALRPGAPSADLAGLAAACVKELDGFRAPLTEAELGKRRKGGLSARQDENLVRWGYPFIGEDFHFHLTLTRRQSEAGAEQTIAALRPHLAEACAGPWRLDSLGLFGDPGGGGHFRLLRRFALRA